MAAKAPGASGPDPEKDVHQINQTLADVQSYPVLTKEIDFTTGPRAGGNGSAAYGQVVRAALQEVLGWRPRDGDAKGFASALNQSFAVHEEQGHTVWKWTPRTYAIEVDLGAVTGAQAAIYARAKYALDHLLPLLEGLKPLNADADSEDLEAARALVRSGLTELVYELGLEGGPRLFRVNELFKLLLGENEGLEDPEKVSGQLGLLRTRFGLQRQYVNTIDEEHNLTNFLILVDETNALRQTWKNQRHYFDHQGTDVFFGTQMVQLSRALTVLAESVQEAYLLMDSVFLGEAERQMTKLEIDDQTIFLGELLSRIEGFATDEGPRLIREGGKDGLTFAFRPIATGLRHLVSKATNISSQGSKNPTRAFHTQRVRDAFAELTTHLSTITQLSEQVQRLPVPFLTHIVPNAALPDTKVSVIIDGARFQPGARLRLNLSGPSKEHIDAHHVDVISEAIITADFKLPDKPDTVWTVVVINPDGREGTLKEAFTIAAPKVHVSAPRIASIEPVSGMQGDSKPICIRGDGFDPRAHCMVSDGNPGIPNVAPDIHLSSLVVPAPDLLYAFIRIDADAVSGPRDVVVKNPDGQSATIKFTVTIAAAGPRIKGFKPKTVSKARMPGKSIGIEITGENFHDLVEVRLRPQSGGDNIRGEIEKSSDTSLVVKLLLDDVPEGAYDVIVHNIDDHELDTSRTFRVTR